MITFTLILSLFFPRLALIIGYLGSGILPNPFSFWADFLLALFVPRILMIAYIAINWETLPSSSMWLILHIGALVLSIILKDND